MGDSLWQDLRDHLKSDEALTRVVHWCHYKDGQTCGKRARAVLHLRQLGWSASEIAAVLGLNRRAVYPRARSVTTTKLISPETTVNPYPKNLSGSTAKETK